MENKREMTASKTSVGADERQSSNVSVNSISSVQPKSNSQFLQTVSMTELYDTIYESKPPLIGALLYPGVYLVCGCAENRQELLNGSNRLPYQHRGGIVELSRSARNSFVSCP